MCGRARKTTLRALLSKGPYIESYATLLIKECQVMLGFFLESEAGGGKRKELFAFSQDCFKPQNPIKAPGETFLMIL